MTAPVSTIAYTMAYYTDLYRQYQQGKPFITGRLQLIRNWLLPHAPHLVLEVACGIGYGAHDFSLATSGTVIAFDYELAPLRFMQTHIRTKPNLHFFRGNVYQTPFPDNHFDAIIFSEVIEHLAEPLRGLSEMRRILKPSGTILVSTWPNRQNFSVQRGLTKGHDFSQKDFNKQSPRSLEILLRQASFTITKKKLTNFYWQLPKTRVIFDNLHDGTGLKKLIEKLLEYTLKVNPFAPWLANSLYYLCRIDPGRNAAPPRAAQPASRDPLHGAL